MEVSPASGTEVVPRTEDARTRLADNFDNFLTLLTTQLQHQDPLSPMDSNEFTNQLVAFAEVEQSLDTNDQLEELVNIQKLGRAASAVGFLGNTIETDGDRFVVSDGRGEFRYTLAANASGTEILITDDLGNRVFRTQGETKAGSHSFVWDGRDEQGNFVGDGIYRVAITPKDASGDVVPATTSVLGEVTGIQQDGDEVLLFVGKLGVPLDEVKSIARPTPPPPASQEAENG